MQIERFEFHLDKIVLKLFLQWENENEKNYSNLNLNRRQLDGCVDGRNKLNYTTNQK